MRHKLKKQIDIYICVSDNQHWWYVFSDKSNKYCNTCDKNIRINLLFAYYWIQQCSVVLFSLLFQFSSDVGLETINHRIIKEPRHIMQMRVHNAPSTINMQCTTVQYITNNNFNTNRIKYLFLCFTSVSTNFGKALPLN